MDFNDIQNAWNNESSKDLKIPKLSKMNDTNLPLSKIKKNIKKEIIIQIIAIILIGLIPLSIEMKSGFLFSYYSAFTLCIIISIYFTLRLRSLYKSFVNLSTSTKDNLYEIYYNIKLFIEVYKSFTYSLMPFGLFFMIIQPLGKKSGKLLSMILEMNIETLVLSAIGIITLFMILIWVMTEAHVKMFYGKYADEIKKVIDQLKEE